jgi:hypothetical protein
MSSYSDFVTCVLAPYLKKTGHYPNDDEKSRLYQEWCKYQNKKDFVEHQNQNAPTVVTTHFWGSTKSKLPTMEDYDLKVRE